MNWDTGYGDWIASPVWDSLRVIPWLEKTALVLGDTIDEETDTEIPVSPRTILKRQVARAAKLGYAVKAGSEVGVSVPPDRLEGHRQAGWGVPKTICYYNQGHHPH